MSAPPPTMPPSRFGPFGIYPPPCSVWTTRYLALLAKNICPDDGAAPAIFGRTRILGFQRAVRYLRVTLYRHSDFTTHFRI